MKISKKQSQYSSIFEDKKQPQILVKCTGYNKGSQFCLNQSCGNKSIFICFDQKCRCQQQHENCQKVSIQSTIKRLKSKIISVTVDINDEIYDRFDKIIDEISDARDKILKDIQDQIKYSQLSRNQISFIELVQNNGQKNIGDQQSILNNNVKNKECDIVMSEQQIKQLKQSCKKQNKQQVKNTFSIVDVLKQTLNQLQKPMQIISEQLKNLVNKIDNQLKNGFQLFHMPAQFFNNSLILKTFQQLQSFSKFCPESWKSVKLLFRATQNNYDIKTYLNKYGKQTNTLFICLTDKDKIIGAYSPLSHLWNGKGQRQYSSGQYVTDESMKSFIFTASDNARFELRDKQYAIYRVKELDSIVFGNSQLRIGNHCNVLNNCNTNINWNYFNKEYKRSQCDPVWVHDAQSCRKLNGNDTAKFGIKQWQVWKVFMIQ